MSKVWLMLHWRTLPKTIILDSFMVSFCPKRKYPPHKCPTSTIASTTEVHLTFNFRSEAQSLLKYEHHCNPTSAPMMQQEVTHPHSLPWDSRAGLYPPLSVPDGVEVQPISNLMSSAGIDQILLVGEDHHRNPSQFLLLQQFSQLLKYVTRMQHDWLKQL